MPDYNALITRLKDHLDDNEDDFSAWEKEFIESMVNKVKYSKGQQVSLTDAQAEKIDKLADKHL